MPEARITVLENGTFVALIEVEGRTIECPVSEDYAYGFDPDEDQFHDPLWCESAAIVYGDDEWFNPSLGGSR